MGIYFIASRLRIKPLLPGEKAVGKASDMESALNKSKRVLLRKIRAKLQLTTFSPRAKRSLSKSLRIEVKPSSLVVTSNHPGFEHIIGGRKKRQMKWLTKARAPIPIITDEGKLIFRRATSRSMKAAQGGPNAGKRGWVHPGRAPEDFLTKAKKETRDFLKKKFASELKKQVKASWSKK